MTDPRLFDSTVKPAKPLGLKLQVTGVRTSPRDVKWCSLSSGGGGYLSDVLRDVWTGEFGNTQRIANMELKKTGYISYEGETIQFSGTLGDSIRNVAGIYDFDTDLEGTTYTGTLKVYRE